MIQKDTLHLHSFVLILNRKGEVSQFKDLPDQRNDFFVFSRPGDHVTMKGRTRKAGAGRTVSDRVESGGHICFFTGDSAEIETDTHGDLSRECCANAAQISINLSSQEITVYSSIVGLPPVFYCEQGDNMIITSDLHLLMEIHDFSFYFDIESVREVATIGYPIGNKTLFENVKMIPAGYVLSVNKNGEYTLSRHWKMPARKETLSWRKFVDSQSTAFKRACKRIHLTDSFLSLTAGMDTRAIVAELTSNKHRIPAYTMSGITPSLDARTARKISKAYGFEHTVVVLDDNFIDGLPHFSREACRLSGGLSSMTQAHEIFFYSKVDSSLNARLSGNLGNQVGRGGAENVSLRNAGLTSFSNAIKKNHDDGELAHWYAPYLRCGGHLSFEFLIEQEIPFSSVANYLVGNHYAVQQTPYADRQLIEMSRNRPVESENGEVVSLFRMRMKDLHHRFVGESLDHSFQRKLIKDTGGAVADIPINWGGMAKGGVSLSGIMLGLKALADAALASKSIDAGLVHKTASLLGVTGVHEYRHYNQWLKGPMKEFALELFSSQSTKQCGLFDSSSLENTARSYFQGHIDNYKHVALSVELSLAAEVFNARLR